MIVKVFSVYDSKALVFQAPFFMAATGAAVRAFGDACNDPQLTLSKHPGDFVLYQIGEFNDETGEFKNTAPAVHLGIGSDYIDSRVRNNGNQGIVPVRIERNSEVGVNGSQD